MEAAESGTHWPKMYQKVKLQSTKVTNQKNDNPYFNKLVYYIYRDRERELMVHCEVYIYREREKQWCFAKYKISCTSNSYLGFQSPNYRPKPLNISSY
jgi:hypothetical protein